MKAAAARCECDGDLAAAAGIGSGPAAEPELRPDAAAKVNGQVLSGLPVGTFGLVLEFSRPEDGVGVACGFGWKE